ncbi:MAG: hypothetical protein QW757_00475 [Candidatus Woesearchaeota archaeon]
MLKEQKKILKFSFLILVSLLIIDLVSAQTSYRALKPFWDFIAYIFNILPSGTTKYIYYKFIIWMLLASVLILLVPNSIHLFRTKDGQGNSQELFPNNETTKKQAKIVAWILSLMMSIGMPNDILDLIFDSYSFLGALLLVAVGPALVFSLTNKSGRRLKGVAFFIAGLMLMIFSTVGTINGWVKLGDLLDWVNTGGFIMMIIGLVMIIQGDEKTNNAQTTQNASNQNQEDQTQQQNNTQHSQVHQTKIEFDKERAKYSLHLVDEILHEIDEFNKKLIEKINLINQEIKDYRDEIQTLEYLFAKIEALKQQISSVTINNGNLSDENSIRELKQELESKLNLSSGHNITTAIRDLRTLEKHLSIINQHIVELQRQQTTLITKSKNNLWNIDNSLEGYTQNEELANLILQARQLIRDIAAKIDEIKRIEHLNERSEYQIIEQNKQEIIQGSNIDNLINAIKTLCDEVITKKQTKKLNTLKTNLSHLLHFLKTQPNHSSPGNKIDHKIAIHQTLLKIANNLNAEGKISDEIIQELKRLKQQLTVISN